MEIEQKCEKEGRLMAKASCDSCVYNVYDEDDETYYCEVDMDEDDAARLDAGTLQRMSVLSAGR